jgi:AcrR family transcriptional regulator
MKAEARREELLEAAMELARAGSYQKVTQKAVAEKVGCANGLVHRYFNTMTQLRRAIISAAIAQQDLPLLAQGLAHKEPKALAAPLELREAAVSTLIGE